MTTWLKQSTATDVEIGPFVDDGDFKTPETALTISQADCQLIKNGGAAAQKNDSTSATHLAGGHYKVPLNSTDTNTLGRLRLYVNESGALPVWRDFMVVPAVVFDSLVAGSDTLHADVTQWNGTNVASPDSAGHPKVTVKSGTGTGEVSLSSGTVALSSTSRAAVADDVWDESLSGHTTTGTAGQILSDAGGASAEDIAAEVVSGLSSGVNANVVSMAGSASAAEKARDGFTGLVRGTAVTGTLTATAFTTNLTETTNDHYKGRILTFIGGDLAGQQTSITAYNGSTKVITVASMTEAPANGDAFIIT